MDQYMAAVVVAVISGIFSTIALLIKRNQDKVISKIDEKSKLLRKEKKLKEQISKKEKELQFLLYEMTLLILDTNMQILDQTCSIDQIKKADFITKAEELKNEFKKISDEIDDLISDHELIVGLSSEDSNNS